MRASCKLFDHSVDGKSRPCVRELGHPGYCSFDGVWINLFHGTDSPEEERDDWGFNGPSLGPFTGVHWTYGELKLILDGEGFVIPTQDDLFVWKGKYYGDFTITSYPENRDGSTPLSIDRIWSHLETIDALRLRQASRQATPQSLVDSTVAGRLVKSGLPFRSYPLCPRDRTPPNCDLCGVAMGLQTEDADGPILQWACFCNGGNYQPYTE